MLLWWLDGGRALVVVEEESLAGGGGGGGVSCRCRSEGRDHVPMAVTANPEAGSFPPTFSNLRSRFRNAETRSSLRYKIPRKWESEPFN